MLIVVFNHWMQTFHTHHEETQTSIFWEAGLASSKNSLPVFPCCPSWGFSAFPQGSLPPYSSLTRDCAFLSPSSLQGPFPTCHAKDCVHLLNRWQLCHVPLIYRSLISLPFYAHQFWTDWINQRGRLVSPVASILNQAYQQLWWDSWNEVIAQKDSWGNCKLRTFRK